MDKYIIKITRKRNKSWVNKGDKEEIHYYQGELNRRAIYNTTWGLEYANKFTKQKSKKIIKEVEQMYEENSKNGTLLKIEVLNSETLEIIDINNSKPVRKVSRFELMEI